MSDITKNLEEIDKKNVTDEQKAISVGALFTLATDEESRKEIIESGGVKTLVDCLYSNNHKLLRSAIGALLNIALDDAGREEIKKYNVVEQLLIMIDPKSKRYERVKPSDYIIEYITGFFKKK
jgi:hypothetical protein